MLGGRRLGAGRYYNSRAIRVTLRGLEGTGKSTVVANKAARAAQEGKASEVLVLCRDAIACCRMEELLERQGLTLSQLTSLGVRSFAEFIQDEYDPSRLLPRAMSHREEVTFLSRHLDELQRTEVSLKSGEGHVQRRL